MIGKSHNTTNYGISSSSTIFMKPIAETRQLASVSNAYWSGLTLPMPQYIAA